MKDFKGISFKWTFRDYQQRVLDNSQKFIADGKVNIVAAPGSGKTILGLEIIKRLGNPCLIFSPTTTIRQQWGERFEEAFLPENSKVEEYVSFDLNEIKLLNSITYQALYSAMDKVAIDSEEEKLDYSNIDLFNLMKEKNIKTICVDEAHHLQNEWQKSLEKFIKGLDKDVKIIALTATPPYDASPQEWERYISVCGEIDDEIFVPELVKEKTLCPHQDFVLFNYPTQKEIESFKTHRENSNKALNEIGTLEFIENLHLRIDYINKNLNEHLYQNYKSIIDICIFLNNFNKKVNKGLFKTLTNKNKIPEMTLINAENALQFLVTDTHITTEEEKEILIGVLKKYSLFHKRKVQLDLSDKLKKSLISSTGKLNSITKIVETESSVLKEKLRMLVLTDYIKKESVVNIGTENQIDNISVVSIFEEIRRNNKNVKVGCLSGGIVILPQKIKEVLEKDFKFTSKNFKLNPIANTNYAIYDFKGNNRDKVVIVSKLFEEGHVQVLVGTQSLLGEGWDSPCINSLILASYVGSFMLSNQMRGRAIRIYKKDKEKTSNIWHLVTVEPEYILEENAFKRMQKKAAEDYSKLNSADYLTLSRRFECFVGPNYSTGEIESGIERITFIEPPFNEKGINQINSSMLAKAKDRKDLSRVWDESVKVNSKTVVENVVPKEVKVPAFTFQNMLGAIFSLSFELVCVIGIIFLLSSGLRGTEFTIAGIIVLCFAAFYGLSYLKNYLSFILNHTTPKQSFTSLSKAVLRTFKDLEEIQDGARLNIKESDQGDICVSIKNATLHEQNIFNDAMRELLSPMDNPRYIIIKKRVFNKKKYDYKYSFACPKKFAINNENVETFKQNLIKSIGNIDIKYVYSEEGRKLLVKCQKESFISRNDKYINKRQKSY